MCMCIVTLSPANCITYHVYVQVSHSSVNCTHVYSLDVNVPLRYPVEWTRVCSRRRSMSVHVHDNLYCFAKYACMYDLLVRRVCIYMYVCLHMHVCICMYAYAYLRTVCGVFIWVRNHILVFMHTSYYTCIGVCTEACNHTQIYAYIRAWYVQRSSKSIQLPRMMCIYERSIQLPKDDVHVWEKYSAA
jgi:hypothetical protein